MTMMLKPTQTIAGIRALFLRDTVRRSCHDVLVGEYIKPALSLKTLAFYLFDDEDAYVGDIVSGLIALAYVTEEVISGKTEYVLTKLGKSFLCACGAPKITRKTADKLIEELKERAQHINEDDAFIDRVEKIYVFGSYVRGEERLGDLDVYLSIAWKDPNRDMNAPWRHANKSGRTFRNCMDQLCWHRTQVYLYLKNKKRSLSFIVHEERSSETDIPEHAVLVEIWPTDRRQEMIPVCQAEEQ